MPLVSMNHTIFTFGGVSVNESLQEILLFGPSSATFMLEPPLNVTKFTRLTIMMDSIALPDMVQLCLYEERVSNRSCTTLKQGENVIAIGEEIFEHEVSQAAFLMLEQFNSNPREGETSLKNISIHQHAVLPLINSDGDCVDVNAIVTGNSTCLCKLGFVSSNGGTVLGPLDTCVSCTRKPFCGFDTDTCERDRDCLIGRCLNGTCLSSVSLHLKMYQTDCLIHYLYLIFTPFIYRI